MSDVKVDIGRPKHLHSLGKGDNPLTLHCHKTWWNRSPALQRLWKPSSQFCFQQVPPLTPVGEKKKNRKREGSAIFQKMKISLLIHKMTLLFLCCCCPCSPWCVSNACDLKQCLSEVTLCSSNVWFKIAFVCPELTLCGSNACDLKQYLSEVTVQF